MPPILRAGKTAFGYFLPAFEASSTKRELTLTASGGLGSSLQLLKAEFSATTKPSLLVKYRDETYSLRLQAPIKFGKKLSVTPYYQRKFAGRFSGSGEGMGDFSLLCLSDAQALVPLWTGLPFSELFSDEAYASFADYATGAEPLSAKLTLECGLLLLRAYGSSWQDLVLPTSLSFAMKREMSRSDDSLSSRLVWEFQALFGAINLFGLFGSYPLTELFESDEYSASYQGGISKVRGESDTRLDLVLQHSATFYARDNRDSLAIDNRFALMREPSEESWTEKLQVSLSLLSGKSWLLDLYSLLLSKASAASKLKPQATSEGLSLASLYLADLSKAKAVSRTIFASEISLASEATDEEAAQLSLKAVESLEFKITVPKMLSLSVKPSLNQTRNGESGQLVFGLSLALSATVSF